MTRRQIWKFEIHSSSPAINVPKGSTYLTVQLQNGVPCVWAIVDPSAQTICTPLEVFGTGWDLPSKLGNHVGTWQQDGLVWHVFEKGKR